MAKVTTLPVGQRGREEACGATLNLGTSAGAGVYCEAAEGHRGSHVARGIGYSSEGQSDYEIRWAIPR